MNSVKVLVGLNFGDVKLGQHCSALSVPYKQCRGSKNSPGAPGQDSVSEAIQQTEGKKKMTLVHLQTLQCSKLAAG